VPTGGDQVKGKVRLMELCANQGFELAQVAPASDFPYQITCMCGNFRDKNELLLGSGLYLFWFRLI
jgi:hypothetical protein